MYTLTNNPVRIVTSQKGSWKWQDAYRISTYEPHLCKNGAYVWRSVSQSSKFAITKSNPHTGYKHGSLNNKLAMHCTDDYGNIVFVS